MAHVALVGPPTPLQETCGAALRVLGHGVETLEPASVFEVVTWAGARGVELLVVDADMGPPCPGESLLRALAEEPDLAPLPRLAVTRSADPAFLARLSRYGLKAVLVDPPGSDPVVDAVGLALREGRPCIAVVDPHPQLRAAALHALEAAGCVPLALEGPSVFGLLRALRRARPDGLVCAGHLPGCALLSLLRALREDPHLQALPVLVTEADPGERAGDLARFGGVRVAPRPVSEDALLAWVLDLLERP